MQSGASPSPHCNTVAWHLLSSLGFVDIARKLQNAAHSLNMRLHVAISNLGKAQIKHPRCSIAVIVVTRLPDRKHTHVAGCWCCAMALWVGLRCFSSAQAAQRASFARLSVARLSVARLSVARLSVAHFELLPAAFIAGEGWPGAYSKDSTAAWCFVPVSALDQAPPSPQSHTTRL